MRIRFAAAPAMLAASVILLAAGQQATAAETFTAEYRMSYLGFVVAKSQFTSRISEAGFELEGSIASAGLGVMFDSTHGRTVVSGQFAKGDTRPDSYSVSYTYGKKAKSTTLSFKKGNVASYQNDPPVVPKGNDWVTVSEAELRGVTDPISAALVRAPSLSKVCSRTMHIFDGELRADIVLSPSQQKAEVPGFDRKATVACKARFVPVAGYQSGNGSMSYLRNKSRMQITFAALGTTGVYAPIHASVGTKYGPVTIQAKRLSPQ
ncbi:MAG: DUF3108 domain-containing protein [Rhizobiaceae bacterium]